MIYILVTIILILIVTNISCGFRYKDMKLSRDIWYRTSAEFAGKLQEKHKHIEQMREDLLDENRF